MDHSETHAPESETAAAEPSAIDEAEPPVLVFDPLCRYIHREPATGKLTDRRKMWTVDGPASARVISRGERRARWLFWKRLADDRYPISAAGAVAHALGLRLGPILEIETREKFDAYWSRARLDRIAKQWQLEPMGPEFSAARGRQVKEALIQDLDQDVALLKRISRDTTATTSARVAAIRARVEIALQFVGPLTERITIPELIPENREAIETFRLNLAVNAKDKEQAKMVIDLLGEWLATNPRLPAGGRPSKVVFERLPLPGQQQQIASPPAEPAAEKADDLADLPPDAPAEPDDAEALVPEVIDPNETLPTNAKQAAILRSLKRAGGREP